MTDPFGQKAGRGGGGRPGSGRDGLFQPQPFRPQTGASLGAAAYGIQGKAYGRTNTFKWPWGMAGMKWPKPPVR